MHAFLFDSHVHFYSCFELTALIEAAHSNLLAHSQASTGAAVDGVADSPVCCLGWTRTRRESDFIESLASVESNSSGWSVDATDDLGYAFGVRSKDGRLIWIYRGTQLISLERLEVLILGSYQPEFQGKSVAEIIEGLGKENLVILPWGVGKWFGRRGAEVKRIVSMPEYNQIFLGDNSSRPALWGSIPAFGIASSVGVKVLPGTDPLSLAGEEKRIGNSGVSLLIDNIYPPAPSVLKKLLKAANDSTMTTYGDRESMASFLINQLRIRLP